MKIFSTLLFMALFSTIQAQSFYDLETIQTIEVTFAQSNWDQLMDAAYASDAGYIMAKSVVINGVAFDSVGVKYKGNSSYQANQDKNPWHIELDTYKEQEYDGYSDVKLANCYNDPSFLRDVLGFQIIRQYMDAPLANYANLYVNGNLIGLYTNTESISKKFVNSRFGSKNNTFFNCSPPEGASPQSSDFPNLVYLGQDSTAYYDAYEIKSDAGWQELIDLCDTLKNQTGAIEKILDVDRALWMLAFDNAIVNLDSYIGAFSQNYYLYRSDYNRFLPVVWDLNESFGVFSMTGTINLNNTASKREMTHLLHANDSDFPLVQKLLAVPMYKRMYLAHLKTILLENFDNGSFLTSGQSIQDKIKASVQADGNKFYTYANFLSNLSSDITSGGGPGGPGGGASVPGISSLMEGRSDYLLGLSDFTQTEPTISTILVSNTSPVVYEEVTITAEVQEANNVYLGHKADAIAPFERVEMFDDGTHGDGAANDGIYGVSIVLQGPTNLYYIYAENTNAGMFSPRRAEHEYHSITADFSSTGDLVINELMASNHITAADQDGEFEDWIELYNNGSSSIDLGGYFLSDDGSDLTQWTFPVGTHIEPNGYLIIWADEDADQAGLHANFKLSASGESLYLSDAAGNAVDVVSFASQTTDISYARIPNGTGDFQITSSTFNANNDGTTDCAGMGGDADNDGVCADLDCDDSDPTIGASQAEGTSCDDGDAATQNDVILADGCTCAGTPITLSDLVINELMASNDTTAADQDGEFEDWIELYNNGSSSIDLSGYFLTDDASDLTQWTFPAGTIIEPDGYLIIWADEDDDQAGFHANFKLSTSGETVLLLNADTSVVNTVTYGVQTTDISYARIPNGTGDFQTTSPTFNANNDVTTDCAGMGGDADNDGVCADLDCDDSDPTIGASQAEGTSCDDGDATTQNDVILADGCTCAGTPITLSDLVINELMASNDTTAADQDGEFEDWIELYNNGTSSIDLSGYFLTDDASDLTQWTFPAGTLIEPDGYLIIWADEDDDQAGLHANFKLSTSGETVLLLNADTSVVNTVTYGVQTTDISYARIPNGTGNFQTTSPTFNANNDVTTDCAGMGGDADNDGVCADFDCDDSDPTIGASQAEGTSCDDGEATTQNDVILADGCTCAGTPITLSDLVINELMASNDTTAADQDGEFEDWIELYNNGTSSIDLSGYFLTDDASDLTQWTFPAGTVIEPDGYLIIWADEDDDQAGLHANFKLSASGETLILSSADNSVVDAVNFPEQTTDVAYGRFPNGTGDFQSINPTFNKKNSISTSTFDVVNELLELKIFPNPASNEITLLSNFEVTFISMYNLKGQKVLAQDLGSKNSKIDISQLNSGMYFIQAIAPNGKVVTHKINVMR